MKKWGILSVASIMVWSANVFADENAANIEPTVVDSGSDCGSDCHWSLDSNGYLTVSGSSTMTSAPWAKYRNVITSANVQGVQSIAYGAFFSYSNLKNVTIDDSVKSIGQYAFYASSPTVYCPRGIDCQSKGRTIVYDKIAPNEYRINGQTYSSIGNINDLCQNGHQCFMCGNTNEGCWADLDENGHLSITGNGAMTSNPWKSVMNSIVSADISGVTSIYGHAFFGAKNLVDITIGDSVKSIEYNAFYGVGISNIVIPDSVTSIGSNAFIYTRSNIYCPQHLTCQPYLGKSIPYAKVGDYYSMNGKMYRNLANMLNGIEMKRIYTISEATEATKGKGKNTFSIRYR